MLSRLVQDGVATDHFHNFKNANYYVLNERQLSGYYWIHGGVVERWQEDITNGHEETFPDDNDARYLEYDSFTYVKTYHIVHFKRINFVLCQLSSTSINQST